MASAQVISSAESSKIVINHRILTPFDLAWRRFKHNRLAMVGLVIVALFVFVGIFTPVLAPFPYDRTNLLKPFLAPGKDLNHLLGTDNLGRDMLSRLMWGVRISLIVAFVGQGFSLLVGLTLGFWAGWRGGIVDQVVNRLLEIAASLPGFLFQIMLMVLIGNGIPQVMAAITLLSWPGMTRLVRAQVLALKDREYVDAARSLGANTWMIAVRHLVPNILNPIIVAITFGVPGFIGAEAGLSFLGYGINEPIPSLGKMVGASSEFLQRYLYMAILPTVILSMLVLGFSFLGDGLRDALDPASERAS